MFPVIRYIDDVLPAIEGRKDFVVAKKDGYTVIDYVYTCEDTFAGQDAAIRRECRGLKFGKDGKIIARPFHKFHNLNEVPETQLENINWTTPHHVYDKLDGSMIHPAFVNGELRLMTRMGCTDVAKQAEEWLKGTSFVLPLYMLFMERMLRAGITPIFEFTSPENRIVLRYSSEELTLLALRHTVSGHYISLKDLSAEGIPTVNERGPVVDPNAFINAVRGEKGEEGVVIRFDDGLFVKLKADEYVLQHRAKDNIRLERNALALIMAGSEDDVLPLLDKDDQDNLKRYASGVRKSLSHLAETVRAIVDGARIKYEDDKKSFAVYEAPYFSKYLRGVAFSVWDGADPLKALYRQVGNNLGSQAAVDGIRELIGVDYYV